MKSFEDYSHMQLDIDCISHWVSHNKLILNLTKCKAMTISRKRNSVYPAQFLLNGIPLDLQLLIFYGLYTLIQSVPKQEKLLVCCIGGSMVTLIITVYLNCIVYLYVPTYNMLLPFGIHASSKTRKCSKNCY